MIFPSHQRSHRNTSIQLRVARAGECIETTATTVNTIQYINTDRTTWKFHHRQRHLSHLPNIFSCNEVILIVHHRKEKENCHMMTMCSRSIVQRSSTAVALFWVFFNSTNVFIVTHAFSGQNQLPASAYNNPLQQQLLTRKTSKTTSSCLWLVPPPGSGYAGPELEINEMPDTYDPMMEYPGTMRPGRTPENMPFHDLPIGDDDPDPVPWPHFQQIEVCALFYNY
jgi:hypothetical protein